MKASEKNSISSIKRFFIVVGFIVATLVIYQSQISQSVRNNSVIQNSQIGEQIKNKVMLLGKVTRKVQNHFD